MRSVPSLEPRAVALCTVTKKRRSGQRQDTRASNKHSTGAWQGTDCKVRRIADHQSFAWRSFSCAEHPLAHQKTGFESTSCCNKRLSSTHRLDAKPPDCSSHTGQLMPTSMGRKSVAQASHRLNIDLHSSLTNKITGGCHWQRKYSFSLTVATGQC